eukprot:7173926-Prymnesium_polylepis.6
MDMLDMDMDGHGHGHGTPCRGVQRVPRGACRPGRGQHTVCGPARESEEARRRSVCRVQRGRSAEANARRVVRWARLHP